jgi:O-antigen/teichoic acid export membrane protein
MSDIFSRFKSTVIQSFFYSMGNFVGKFSGIILLPLYSLYLPVELFGLFALFEVIFQVFQVFSGLGIKLGMSRWYWDEKATLNKKSLFFTTYFFNTIVCLLFSIGLYYSFNFLETYYFKSSINHSLIVLFISGNLIRLFSEVPMLLLRVQHKAKEHSFIQIIQLLSYLGFVAFFLVIFKFKLKGIFWANILSGIVQFVFLVPVIFRNIQFKFELKILKEMIVYGFPVALGNMVNITFNFTDKYFINWFTNLKNVGTFTLAHKISNVVNLLIVNAFMNAYMHIYFKGISDSDNDRFYSKSFTYFLLLLTLTSLLIIVFIDEAIVLFTANNKNYFGSASIVPVLTIGLIFGGIRQMLTLPINKVKKNRIIGTVSIIAGILNAMLNYLFIPRWASLGAAYATGIVQILSAIILLFYTQKYANMKFEWKRIGLVFLAFFLSIMPLYFNPFDCSILKFILKVVILIFWIGFLIVTGFFTREEKQRILYFWIKWKNVAVVKSNIRSLRKND